MTQRTVKVDISDAEKLRAELVAVREHAAALAEAAKDFQHSTSVYRLRKESRDQFVALVIALHKWDRAQEENG